MRDVPSDPVTQSGPATRREDSPLWRKWKASGDPELRDRLVREHLHLVKYVIHRLVAGGTTDHEVIDYNDLFAAGVTGLINAVDHFDLERGVKFVTYAVPRIRGAVIDELRAIDWFPRALRQRVNELYRVFRDLEVELGRSPTDAELRERLEIDAHELDALLQAASRSAVLSLNEEFGGAEEGAGIPADTTPDRSAVDPRDRIHRRQAIRLVEEAIRALPERERLVITLYYFDEMTLKEIGAALDVTESRVCQIHGAAALRLKARLADLHPDLAGLL